MKVPLRKGLHLIPLKTSAGVVWGMSTLALDLVTGAHLGEHFI